MSAGKCCGKPDTCQRACTFAAAERGRAFSRYVADHVHNPPPVAETGVTSPIDDKIQTSTLLRVLSKQPAGSIRRSRSTPKTASATRSCRCISGRRRRPRTAAWHSWTAS